MRHWRGVNRRCWKPPIQASRTGPSQTRTRIWSHGHTAIVVNTLVMSGRTRCARSAARPALAAPCRCRTIRPTTRCHRARPFGPTAAVDGSVMARLR